MCLSTERKFEILCEKVNAPLLWCFQVFEHLSHTDQRWYIPGSGVLNYRQSVAVILLLRLLRVTFVSWWSSLVEHNCNKLHQKALKRNHHASSRHQKWNDEQCQYWFSCENFPQACERFDTQKLIFSPIGICCERQLKLKRCGGTEVQLLIKYALFKWDICLSFTLSFFFADWHWLF